MKKNSELLAELIQDIESSNPQVILRRPVLETFELWEDPALLTNLSGNNGAFIVRSLLNKLGIDEHYISRWRLENKYWQYQVLNYYVPGCMPQTLSLSEILAEENGAEKARRLCSDGFFMKSALGDGSGRDHNFDRTGDLEEIIYSQYDKQEYDEMWLLQKKLNLSNEFRVHTFGIDVLYGLTMPINNKDVALIPVIEKAVKIILDKLPESILQGTLIGWDVALTDNSRIYIIEANITGFHPEYQPGFQTSGYFGDYYYGSMMCAWLNNYFKNNYNIFIDSVEEKLLSSFSIDKEFLFYTSIFTAEQLLHLNKGRNGDQAAALIYLGADINCLTTKLLDFFQLGSFAKYYYLIVRSESLFSIGSLFSRYDHIRVVGENEIFSDDELRIMEQLNYESRQTKAYRRISRVIQDKFCFTV